MVKARAGSFPQLCRPPAHLVPRAHRRSLELKSEVVDGASFFAQRSVKPLTVAAAAAMAASFLVAQGAAPDDSTLDPTGNHRGLEINALTPLRDAVERAARRDINAQVSRSGARVKPESDVGITNRSDAAITVAWTNPDLGKADRVAVRRTEGRDGAKTVKEGESVPLEDTHADFAVDSGLTPNTVYTYTVFIVSDDAKPMIAANVTAKTRRFPVELGPGDTLIPGEKLVSPDGSYALAVSGTGALELRNPNGVRVWTPSITSPNTRTTLSMDSGGELRLHDKADTLWATQTDGNPGAAMRLTNDGDIQLWAGQTLLWHRGRVSDIALGDDYPFRGGSPLGYSPSNCTDFAAWRLNKYAGVTSSPWRFTRNSMTPNGGNAIQWAGHFPNQTDGIPALGAVAWWGANTGRGRGHVAIVTAIHGDGSITIEEYNFYNSHAFGARRLYPGRSDWPTRFIHINDVE